MRQPDLAVAPQQYSLVGVGVTGAPPARAQLARNTNATMGVPGYRGKRVRSFKVASDSVLLTISHGNFLITTFTERLAFGQLKRVCAGMMKN